MLRLKSKRIAETQIALVRYAPAKTALVALVALHVSKDYSLRLFRQPYKPLLMGGFFIVKSKDNNRVNAGALKITSCKCDQCPEYIHQLKASANNFVL